MKKITFLFCLLPFISFGQWTQLGADIDGESTGDESGSSISLNANGSVMAVAAPRNSDIAGQAGQVRIFDWDGSSWDQRGMDINGSNQGDLFGDAISISSDGNIIAVGAPAFLAASPPPGYTRVFEWDGANWTQLGSDLIGEANNDSFGTSVSINGDGTILAVGASSNGGNGMWSGATSIYEWDGNDWVQLGATINGEAPSDFSGDSITINAAGTIVAIGALGNDGSANSAGHCRVYEWDGTNWNQKGADIDGTIGFNFGNAVSLDESGNTLSSGGYGDMFTGYTNIYDWDGTDWVQKGASIIGDQGSDFFGTAGDLSGDGNTIAIGAFGNDNGYARVYSFDGANWSQEGDDIIGETEFDQFGSSVSLSNNGSIVAIGTPSNAGNGMNAGHVRVFQNETLGIVEDFENELIFYPNPTNNRVYITTNEPIGLITLFNILGQEILSIKGNGNLAQLDLSDLAAGSYFAVIQTDNTIQTIKLIKK